jgi:hypothetical protein
MIISTSRYALRLSGENPISLGIERSIQKHVLESLRQFAVTPEIGITGNTPKFGFERSNSPLQDTDCCRFAAVFKGFRDLQRYWDSRTLGNPVVRDFGDDHFPDFATPLFPLSSICRILR